MHFQERFDGPGHQKRFPQVFPGSFVAPGVVVSGNVNIGEGCFIGAGSIISNGVNIGANVIIGAGTVVTKDIPANVSVIGNPMRILDSKLELR